MADVNRGNRPLSPHLSIYRMPLLAVTSILNRITGVAMLGSAILIVWWFAALAAGPEAYELANGLITSWLGDLVMILSLWALFYHALAGVRHLIWDSGFQLDLAGSERMTHMVIIGSVVLTVFTIVIV